MERTRRACTTTVVAALALLAGACSTSVEVTDISPQPVAPDTTQSSPSDTHAETNDAGASAAPTAVPTELPPTPTPVTDADGCPLDAPDYTGIELVGEVFRSDLRCADFTAATIASTQLLGAQLDQVTFAGATLTNVSFDSVDASNVDFSNASLLAVEFEEVNLTGANFTGAQLIDVGFDDTTCPDGTNSGQNGETCINNLGSSG